MRVLPRTFRRQAWAFYLSVAATVVGMVVGGVLLLISPEGREVALAPFPHVAQQTPSQRVAMEEEMNATPCNGWRKAKPVLKLHSCSTTSECPWPPWHWA